MLRLSLLTTMVAVLFALAGPSAAHASPQQIYDDCQDNGRLDKQYSQSDYRKALREISEDLDEYTNCSDLIRAGMSGVETKGKDPNRPETQGGGGGTGGTGGTGGGTPQDLPEGNGVGSVPIDPKGKPLDPLLDAQDDEKAAVTSARAGQDIVPTAAGVRPGEADGDLPTPLLVVLALAALAGLAAAALGVKQLLFSGPRTA